MTSDADRTHLPAGGAPTPSVPVRRSDRGIRLVRAYWKVLNPFTRWLAGYVPWWVVLETTGRRSGKRRRTPFANGPYDGERIRLIAVHGERSAFAHNIAADPTVRVKRRGRWHSGTARLTPITPADLESFGAYARGGLRTFGADPRIVVIDLDTGDTSAARD